MAFLYKVFQTVVGVNASDVHVCPGEPFIVRRFGRLAKMKSAPLASDQTQQLILEILNDDRQSQSLTDHQLDFAIDREQLGRFRGSAMRHNRGLSAVFRRRFRTLPALGCPRWPKQSWTTTRN